MVRFHGVLSAVIVAAVCASTLAVTTSNGVEMAIQNSAPRSADNLMPAATVSAGAVMLSEVPTSEWTYGCSATSAGMVFGYYDRHGYSNMYSGPANGGVAPLTDLGSSCGLIATEKDFDGRTTRGHVDDYWTGYGDVGPDPYEGHWSEHVWADCTADFLGTNQWKWDFSLPYGDGRTANSDGSTTYFFYSNGTRLNDYVPSSSCGMPQTEMCHGMRLFAESRGYTVELNYTQKIREQSSDSSQGFTFADYMSEIDLGYPVMIHVTGHTMVGVGYEQASQTIYLHDTWDNSVHSMFWNSQYSGMQHQAMTVMHLAPVPEPGVMLLLIGPSVYGLLRRRSRA